MFTLFFKGNAYRRRRYRSAKNRRRPRNKWRKYTNSYNILITGLFIITVTFSVYVIFQKLRVPKILYNKETFCPEDESLVKKVYVFVIDNTDSVSKAVANNIKRKIERIIDRSNKHDRIILYKILGVPEDPIRKVFDMCSLGRAGDYNPLFESVEVIMREKDKKFFNPLNKELENLLTKKEEPMTPLLEGLKYISNDIDFMNNTNLHIFTDMLHNTKKFSLYKRATFESFRKSSSFYIYRVAEGVFDSVHVYIIPRINLIDKQRNAEKFWRDYFKYHGAKVVFHPL